MQQVIGGPLRRVCSPAHTRSFVPRLSLKALPRGESMWVKVKPVRLRFYRVVYVCKRTDPCQRST